MPDIIEVVGRNRKTIFLLTVTATVVALVASLLSPKKYLSITTALPANTALADKGRMFNNNIETLYPELGVVDELDKIEGTARLDTLFVSVASAFNLAEHYGIKDEQDPVYKAALVLKKNTAINRTAYGELQVKVWDGDSKLAAQLANALLQTLNALHRRVQNANTEALLKNLKEDLIAKQLEVDSFEQRLLDYQPNAEPYRLDSTKGAFSGKRTRTQTVQHVSARMSALTEVMKQEELLITQYELALRTSPDVLVIIEKARPSVSPDKPRVAQTTVFAFVAALLFSVLLAFILDRRNKRLDHQHQ